jgi:hypothetical protein
MTGYYNNQWELSFKDSDLDSDLSVISGLCDILRNVPIVQESDIFVLEVSTKI